MAEIDVANVSDDDWQVSVRERDSQTTHVVTVTDEALSRYGGGASASDLLEASFRFLLEREPKEAILSRFDLPAIEQYFPDYADRVREYL